MLDFGNDFLAEQEGKEVKKKKCGNGAILKLLLQKNANLKNRNRILKKQLQYRQVCRNCVDFRRERDFLFRKCKNYERQLEQFENQSKTVGHGITIHPDTVLLSDIGRKLEEARKEISCLAKTLSRLTQTDSVDTQRKASDIVVSEARDLFVSREVREAILPKTEDKDVSETCSIKSDEDPEEPFYDYVDVSYKLYSEDEEDETLNVTERNGSDVQVVNLMCNSIPGTVESGNSEFGRTERENNSTKHICEWIGDRGAKCHQEFSVIKQLIFHIKAKHILKLNPGDLVCSWNGCERNTPFPCKTSLFVHVLAHTDTKLFKCPFGTCPRAYSTESDLKNHAEAHAIEFCKGSSRLKDEILDDNTGSLEPHVMDDSEGELQIAIPTEKPNDIINEVPKASCEEQKMVRKREHPDEKGLLDPLEELNRNYFDAVYYTCWWKCGLEGEPCGEMLPSWDQLVAHVGANHIDGHPRNPYYCCQWYDCKSQGKTLWLWDSFVSHLRAHTRLGVFSQIWHCERNECARAFDCEASLARHRRTHEAHKSKTWVLCVGETVAQKDPSWVQCEFPGCRRQFDSMQELELHVKGHRTMAMREKAFSCEFPECERRCANQMALSEHVLSHIVIQSVGQATNRNLEVKDH